MNYVWNNLVNADQLDVPRVRSKSSADRIQWEMLTLVNPKPLLPAKSLYIPISKEKRLTLI